MFGIKLTIIIITKAEASPEAAKSNTREPPTQSPACKESGYVAHTTINSRQRLSYLALL